MLRGVDWRWVAIVTVVCLMFGALCAVGLYALDVSWGDML